MLVDEKLIAFDSLHFIPKEMNIQEIGLLEDALYIGSVWVFSPKAKEVNIQGLQETLRVEEGLQAGMTTIQEYGIHCRWLGRDQWTLQQEMKRIYKQLAEIV